MYLFSLKGTYTCKGTKSCQICFWPLLKYRLETTLTHFLPPYWKGVYSLGSQSFLLDQTPFRRVQKVYKIANRKSGKLCQKWQKIYYVYLFHYHEIWQNFKIQTTPPLRAALAVLNGFFLNLTLVLLNPDIPCLCKQCRSRSVGFWRSQLIWICTVCH